jgi:hypothetical protein
MNKKILLLIILLLTTITINIINIYLHSKKELASTLDNYYKYEKKAKQYNYLKNRYTLKPLKYIRDCKIYNTQIECKKVNLTNLSLFLKSNIKLKKFIIQKDNFKGEIDK